MQRPATKTREECPRNRKKFWGREAGSSKDPKVRKPLRKMSYLKVWTVRGRSESQDSQFPESH